jgi:hypothetical protein
MKYNDFRDEVISDLVAVLAKHGGRIGLNEDGDAWIVSLPPTELGKQMGACGCFLYVREVADAQPPHPHRP